MRALGSVAKVLTIGILSALCSTSCHGGGPAANPPGPAGVSDANGNVTLVSSGLTVAFQLEDRDTGLALPGVAVALGQDPSAPDSALLVVSDGSVQHPLQFFVLQGPPAATARAQPSPAPGQTPQGGQAVRVDVSNGCPLALASTTNLPITIGALPTQTSPPPPVMLGDVEAHFLQALNAMDKLDPSLLPAGNYGVVTVDQYTPSVPGQCASDLLQIYNNIANLPHAEQTLFLLIGAEVFPVVGVPAKYAFDAYGLVELFRESLTTAQDCYFGEADTIVPITVICFGGGCIAIPQLPTPPPMSPTASLVHVPVNITPPPDSITFVKSDSLGTQVVGTSASDGTAAVDLAPGSYVVCADSKGYQPFTNLDVNVSAPGMPIDAVLTPTSPGDAGGMGGNGGSQGNGGGGGGGATGGASGGTCAPCKSDSDCLLNGCGFAWPGAANNGSACDTTTGLCHCCYGDCSMTDPNTGLLACSCVPGCAACAGQAAYACIGGACLTTPGTERLCACTTQADCPADESCLCPGGGATCTCG